MALNAERTLAEILPLPELAFGTLARLLHFRQQVLEQATVAKGNEMLVINAGVQSSIAENIGSDRTEAVVMLRTMLSIRTVGEENRYDGFEINIRYTIKTVVQLTK